MAEHYLSLVNIAMDLKEISDLRRKYPESVALKDREYFLVQEIANKHDEDFGIELKWKDENANP